MGIIDKIIVTLIFAILIMTSPIVVKLALWLLPKEDVHQSERFQIPFEVYYADYNKTVHVVASCDAAPNARILTFPHNDADIKARVMDAVNKAFDQPGITHIKVCRVKSKE